MAPCPHLEAGLDSLFSSSDYVTGERFEIRQCRACGLALTWPPPSASALEAYYPAGYYGRSADRRFPWIVEATQGLLYRWRARMVEGLAGAPGRVLDVGCGRGQLLAAFRCRGWSVEGTERSASAARVARDVVGVPVHIGALDALALPSHRFDAVVLWHVLEHVAEPAPLLAEVARVLRPGGVCLVGVPNFASPEAQLSQGGWFHLDVPRHVVQFTPETLRALLAEVGLLERRSSFFAPEYDLISFMQSTLNRIGLRKNLLYELLRRHDAKLLDDVDRLAWQRALSWGLAVPLGTVGLPVTLLADLAGRGSSVSIYACKKER
jgi:SAM-dependent methyltransferase